MLNVRSENRHTYSDDESSIYFNPASDLFYTDLLIDSTNARMLFFSSLSFLILFSYYLCCQTRVPRNSESPATGGTIDAKTAELTSGHVYIVINERYACDCDRENESKNECVKRERKEKRERGAPSTADEILSSDWPKVE